MYTFFIFSSLDFSVSKNWRMMKGKMLYSLMPSFRRVERRRRKAKDIRKLVATHSRNTPILFELYRVFHLGTFLQSTSGLSPNTLQAATGAAKLVANCDAPLVGNKLKERKKRSRRMCHASLTASSLLVESYFINIGGLPMRVNLLEDIKNAPIVFLHFIASVLCR